MQSLKFIVALSEVFNCNDKSEWSNFTVLSLKKMTRVVLITFILCYVSWAGAAELSIPPFSNSQMAYSQSEEDMDYRVVLGPLKKVNGIWVAKKEIRLAGLINSSTYLIPTGYKPMDVIRYYEGILKRLSYVQKYACDGRACGSSDRFASHIFKRRELLGPDDFQLYRVGELEFEKKSYVILLYAIQRGNKKVYMYLNLIEKSSLSTQSASRNEEIIALLEGGTGYAIYTDELLQGVLGVEQMSVLDNIVRFLKSRSQLKLFLVGHRYGSESLLQLRESSLKSANEIRNYLVDSGISAPRLTTYGLGPLAPGQRRDRVELVINDYR